MNIADEPATDLQLSALKKFGYNPDHALSRSEASSLLMGLHHPPPPHDEEELPLSTAHHPYHFRKCVEKLKEGVAQSEQHTEPDLENQLRAARTARQEFWMDTCRDVTKMQFAWPEIISLYQVQGCRFVPPTHDQTQTILDALDTALPHWDRDHPELFYKTLELNFPQLVQTR
jgi:hypothetical protein